MKLLTPVNIAAAVVGTAVSVWAGVTENIWVGIISAVIWLAAIIIPRALKYTTKVSAYILAGALAINLVVYFAAPSITGSRNNGSQQSSTAQTSGENDPDGTIVVDALSGILTNPGSYSYISDSDTGGKAYLADKDATATYKVIAEKAGTYTLKVKSIDDGKNKDGDQNVTITISTAGIGTKALKYIHHTQVTNGWKWFTIGEAELGAGENTVTFVKDASTYVAFTMSEFKFIPQD